MRDLLPALFETTHAVCPGGQQECHSNRISPQIVSPLYKYDLRWGDLFVLYWPRVRQVCLGSVSSVLFINGGSVCDYYCEVGVLHLVL